MEIGNKVRQYIMCMIMVGGVLILIFSCRYQESKIDISLPVFTPSKHVLLPLSPKFSVQSTGFTLHQQYLRLRNGKELPIIGMLRVDGKLYRFMGGDSLRILPLAPLSDDSCGWKCKFSYLYPGSKWEQLEYNDSAWFDGVGAFGSDQYPYATHSLWASDKIYVRRHVAIDDLKSFDKQKLYVRYVCDDQIKLYVNGNFVLQRDTWTSKPICSQLPNGIIRQLHSGDNLIAAHGQNPHGAALLDVGLYLENDKYNEVDTATLKQMDVQVTQTKYVFQCGEVELQLNFVSPALVEHSDIAKSPVGFITYKVSAKDDKQHDIHIVFDVDTEWMHGKNKTESRIEQDWRIIQSDSLYMGVVANETEYTYEDGHVVVSQKLCKEKEDGGVLLLGYSENELVQYEGENLLPYWNKYGDRKVIDLLKLIGENYKDIRNECNEIDLKWNTKAFQTKDQKYAEHMILSCRDFLSEHRFVMTPDNKKLLCFADTLGNVKQSFSYFPTLLFFEQIDWMKGLLTPIFEYSENDTYMKRYPPYDIGLFPVVSRQMKRDDYSIEVTADMLMMVSAIVDAEQNFDYANLHWNTLCQWADYLKDTLEGNTTFPCELLSGNDERVKAVLGWKAYQKLIQCKKEYE